MLTKTTIITSISKDRDYHRLSLNIAKEYNLSKDLFQELLIVLLNYKDEVIIDLYEKKQLKFFCSRIMTNMYNNTASPFCKTYRNKNIEIAEYRQAEAPTPIETYIPKGLKELMNMPIESIEDKEFVLLRLSIELGGISEVAKETGIERSSVHKAIDRVKLKLKNDYGKI